MLFKKQLESGTNEISEEDYVVVGSEVFSENLKTESDVNGDENAHINQRITAIETTLNRFLVEYLSEHKEFEGL
jgi:hypothetical protein